jgi:hypothetical protein
MPQSIAVPVKKVGNVLWGDLTAFGLAHEVCGERVDMVNQQFSFQGGHRVRLYKFKKNVHWKIPVGIQLDISAVDADEPKRKQKPGR